MQTIPTKLNNIHDLVIRAQNFLVWFSKNHVDLDCNDAIIIYGHLLSPNIEEAIYFDKDLWSIVYTYVIKEET